MLPSNNCKDDKEQVCQPEINIYTLNNLNLELITWRHIDQKKKVFQFLRGFLGESYGKLTVIYMINKIN